MLPGTRPAKIPPPPPRFPGRLQALPQFPDPAGRDGHPPPEGRVVPQFTGQRVRGELPVFLPPADQRDVASRGDRPNGGLADPAEVRDRAHLEGVGEEDPAEPELPPQQADQDSRGEGGRARPVQCRVEDVGGHQGRDSGADGAAEREKIPGLEDPAADADDRQFLVGVGVGSPVTREMLADREDPPGEGSAEEGDSEAGDLFRVARKGTVPDHRVVRAAVHVQDRGEVHIHPHGEKLLRDRRPRRLRRAFGMDAEGGVGSGRREPGESRLRKALDPSPFLVDGDQRRGPAPACGGPDLAAEFPRLRGRFHVPGEEDHPEEGPLAEPGGDPRWKLDPLEPGHQRSGREAGGAGGHRDGERGYFTDPIVNPAMKRSRKKV